MKRKIIGITIMLILISSPLTLFVQAGSEKNPEIEDETGECPRSIDIKSAWFFEKPNEPEYLYIKMKLANFKIFRMGQGFNVDFKINNESYQVYLCKVFFPALFYILRQEMRNGSRVWYDDYFIHGQVNKINNIISWKVPKDLIGNPEVGDHITSIDADSIDLGRIFIRYIVPQEILEKFNITIYDLYKSGIPVLQKFYDYFKDEFLYSWDLAGGNGKDYIVQY